MRLAVAGGTGLVGTHVVAAARGRGHDVVVLSRSTGVDVTTGHGLVEALEGADAVIDVTDAHAVTTRGSTAFFEAATDHLLGAEAAVGVGHHVALSIVGIDPIDSLYYAGKLAQERALVRSGRPHTIARATQFHELVARILDLMPGPVAFIPRMPVRPVAAREVGEHLVTLAEAGPQGWAADLVGPRDEEMAELARRLLERRGARRRVVRVRLPGAYGRGIASGTLCGDGTGIHGEQTFEEWLHEDAGSGGA